MSSTGGRKRRKLLLGFFLSAGVLLVIELAYRLGGPWLGVDPEELSGWRTVVVEGKTPSYVPRAHTIYGLRPRPGVNSFGFRAPEWNFAREPRSDRLRILCLGGSTTESGYPEMLETALGGSHELPVDVWNAGVSGWTTAEITVAWFLLLRDLRPDVVVLHVGGNDATPRLWAGFRPDYSHYRYFWDPPRYSWITMNLVQYSDAFAHWSARLMPRPELTQITTHSEAIPSWNADQTVPAETSRSFRRNVELIGRDAASWGGRVVLMTMPLRRVQPNERPFDGAFRHAVAQHNSLLRLVATREGWLLVDAARGPAFAHDAPVDWFTDMIHLVAAGKRRKARLVSGALQRAPWWGTAETGR